MRLHVIGNPNDRRIALLQAALANLGRDPANVIPYGELLRGNWTRWRDVRTGDVVRIESPGEDVGVNSQLIARGGHVFDKSPATVAGEHGEIFQPHWWFAGFCSLLDEIKQYGQARGVTWMNAPDDITVMFDKPATHHRLLQAGLPVPPALPPVGSYDELCAAMKNLAEPRVFVKLSSSSSASGVVALRRASGRVCATTSVEMVRTQGELQLFNSLRVRHYRSERDVAALIDALCLYGVHVERWIPKAGWRGRTFDLRVVVIAGEACHVVMRTSDGPLTNLHLGNRRGDVECLLSQIDPEARESAWASCRRVAELFPDSLYSGVDLMFTPGFKQHYILEVNAFGDLLPNVLSQGEDTYSAQVNALLAQDQSPAIA